MQSPWSAGRNREFVCRVEVGQAAAAREPWLLSCSSGSANFSAEAIVRLYAQRMKIEQGFRDTKNERLGLGLTRSRSHGQRRLEALLLIGHVASIAKRLIGEAAKATQLQLELITRKQAKHHNRAELPVLTMATRVIASPVLMQKIGNPLAYLQRLLEQARACSPLPSRYCRIMIRGETSSPECN